jgi:hypothetical protein
VKDGAVGRFADSGVLNHYTYGTPRNRDRGKIWRHPNATVISAIRLAEEIGQRKAASQLKIPYKTVETWCRLRFLPKTGKHTFPKMLQLVTLARRYYRVSKLGPITCLKWAVARTPDLKWGSVKVFLYFQAMPTLPGFPLYADPIANEKAELYGRGLRSFSAVLGVEPPDTGRECESRPVVQGRNGRPVVPRQKGRTFFPEGQVSTLLPSRKYNPA